MFHQFFRNRDGNIAMIFGLVFLTLMTAGGVAIDFMRRSSASAAVQEALDAAVLAAARTASLSETERRLIAEKIFAANLSQANLDITVTPVIVFDSANVTASADYDLPTTLLAAAGMPAMTINNTSEAVAPGLAPAEFVLVLDYSSSMDGKYNEMRDAAIELLNVVTDNGAAADIKTGLVPFANEVYATVDGAYVLDGVAGVPWSNCTRDRRYPFNTTDETPLSGDDDSKWGRTDGDNIIDPDEYDECGNYPANNLIVRPLSADHAGTIAQLNAMTPHEGTNITIGIEFASHVLSPNEPWTEADAYGGDTKKFVVLLSDGRHNKDGFGPGATDDEVQARANMQEICTMLKNKGATVITVAYDLDDEDGKAELEQCATSSQYFLEGDEYNIMEQFQILGNFLMATTVRLTR